MLVSVTMDASTSATMSFFVQRQIGLRSCSWASEGRECLVFDDLELQAAAMKGASRSWRPSRRRLWVRSSTSGGRNYPVRNAIDETTHARLQPAERLSPFEDTKA